MTPEQAKELVKGDTVFINAGGMWGCNAMVDGRACRIEARSVVNVNQKTVATGSGSYRFEELISQADADAAKAAFAQAEAARIERERRATAAVELATSTGFRVAYYNGGLSVSASGVDEIERLAATLATAHRGRQLADEIGRALPVDGHPVVTLHLSVAQAQTVIATLGGAA